MNNNTYIGIIGAGQMGVGIAALCAFSGFQVKLIDVFPEALLKAKNNIRVQLEKFLDALLRSHSIENILSRISYDTELAALDNVNIVIEAIPEDIHLKQQLYHSLNSVVPSNAIIATNTSSFSIAELAGFVSEPERFIGIHFMNPVLKMELVEVIPTQDTSSAIFNESKKFIERLQKHVVVSKDSAGFVVNRLIVPMINEAFAIMESGIASKEDIDIALEKGASLPMGPLKLADFIGLDTCVSILHNLDKAFPNRGYTPNYLLKTYVNQGFLGRKTKKGVYSY